MKKFYNNLFLIMLSLLCVSNASAQITVGKVYNFQNVNYGSSMTASGTDKAVISDTDINDKAQLWYVGDGGNGTYTLRNLNNGYYLQGNGTSKLWGFVRDASEAKLYMFTAGENMTFGPTGDQSSWNKMHYGGNEGYVVGWEINAQATQWTAREVSMDPAELAAIWADTDALLAAQDSEDVCQAHLDKLFTDNSCTVLKKDFVNEAAIDADADYQALPSALQSMVKKVFNDNWYEANAKSGKAGWDSKYAKKFRVQMYEPYSVAGGITSFLNMNPHANNDNPTGVYVHERGLLYVMVEGEIKSGATLRIVDGGSNDRIGNATTGGAELKTGLNVIPCYSKGGHLYICYNVETYNKNDETFPNKLSDFEPLKIHIEGGSINGFYNACGDFRAENDAEDLWKVATGASVDCDADWEYYEERANLSVVPILGHRQIMLFQLEDTYDSDGAYQKGMKSLLPDQLNVPSTPNSRTGKWDDYGMNLNPSTHKINIMMEAWDRIMYSELASMGLLSEEAINKMNDLYPRWNGDGTRGEIYSYGAEYRELCNGRDYSEYFNHHGTALGTTSGYMYGSGDHCGYNINTFGDIVSNIAVAAGATWGPGHEIGHQHQHVFNLNGQTEVTNNFFANVAVWYMGMGTSRYNGDEGSLEHVLAAFNTEGNDAYTNNIWALTHIYYRLWLYYHLAGNNTQFWPRLFELCRQEPLVNGGQISGETSLLRFYRHACDAAGEDLTEFFRAHGYLEVMDNRFVGDYANAIYNVTQEQIDAAVNAVKAKGYKENLSIIFINDGTSQTTLRHDGTSRRSLWDGSASAEIGSVNDFISGTSVTELYSANVNSDGVATMSGGFGAVGFLVLDNDGKVLSFSNKTQFALGKEARDRLMFGEARFVAVGYDSGLVEVNVDFTTLQLELLAALVADIEAMPIDDGTYRRVGCYTQASAFLLLEALESAKVALTSGIGYTDAYNSLNEEREALLSSETSVFVPFDPSLTYVITSYVSRSHKMSFSNSNLVYMLTNPDQDKAKWRFVSTGTDGEYYMQNVGTGYYLPAVADGYPLMAVGSQDAAAKYVVQQADNVGTWFIGVTPHSDKTYLHFKDYYGILTVVGYSTDADATKWYLTAVEENNNGGAAAVKDALAILAAKTQALIKKVSTSSYGTGELPLSTNPEDDYYIFCSNPHVGGDDGKGGVAALLDNDPATYLHSNWTSPSLSNDYLQVNLGSGNELRQLQITGVQRSGDVYNDFPQTIKIKGSADGENWDHVADVTGLPQKAGASWESETITIDNLYPYLRFDVTTGTDRKYFHLAEFKIIATVASVEMRGEYASVDCTLVKDALKVLNNPLADVNTATDAEIEAYMALLQVAYDNLYTACEAVIDVKKEELQAMIDATDELVETAGNVTKVGGPVALDASNLYSNATIAEGRMEDLFDGADNTFIHTQWEGTSVDDDYHYLRLDMGEEASIGEFYFTYTTVKRDFQDMPKTIVVEGANEIDGDNSTKDDFVEIVVLTDADGLPQNNNAINVYTSPRLGSADRQYRYLRFKVTEISRASNTGKITDDGGHPFFTMAEFGVAEVDHVTVTVADSYIGTDITEEMLLEAYNAVASAAALMDNDALTIAIVDAKIRELAAIKAAMEEAMNQGFDKSELASLVREAEDLVNEVAEVVDGEVVMRGDFQSPNLPVSLVVAVYEELLESKLVLTTKVTEEEYHNAIAELQAAYEALASAAALKNIPVLLSADINNPAVYKIGIKRGETKVLEYDAEGTRMVAVEDYREDDILQAWYFTKGTAGDQVFIHPYLGLGDVLASNDVTDGPEKVKAMPKDSEGYMQEWILATVSDGVYNIKPAEGATYFSHHGGGGNKMGFYSSSNTTDIGSLFTFERVEIGAGAWRNLLDDYLATQCEVENVASGSGVGCFVNGEDYNAARAAAVELLADTTATAEVYENCYNTLRAAREALEIIYPEEGKYYTLYNPGLATYVYAGRDNRIYHALDMSGNSAAVWQFERNEDGTFKLFNMHNGQYVKALGWDEASYLGDEAGCVISIESQYHENYVFVKGNGNEMHAKGNGELVRYNTHTVGKSSWIIKEVEGDIAYTLSVEESGWATLVLGFNAVIPEAEDFKAYTVERVDEFVYLSEAKGVLDANTPVVINAAEGEYAFTYTTAEATVQPAADLLAGTLYDRYVAGEAYQLSDADGEIGFRKVIMDKDAEGADGTTHFLNNANKAYLVLPEASGISFYGIRFGNEDDEETGIENVPERSAVGKVYDLTGRRVNDVLLKGVYIIDGKKVVK